MSFWVSETEQKKIKKLVAKTGLSQREYLLSAALGRTIYQVEELKPTLFELKASAETSISSQCSLIKVAS